MNWEPDVYLKVGDSGRSITIRCTYSDGTVQDLTGATGTFAMWRRTGVVKVADAAATIIGAAANGDLQYTPGLVDTDVPGDFESEFHVTLPNGKKVTFPTGPAPERYIKIRIDPRIA